MDREAQQRIMGFFIEESRDHLTNLEQGLLNLRERSSDEDLINELFRAAHSIKGGAGMLGIGSIQNAAHRLEDVFKVFRERPVPADQTLETLLLQGYDALVLLFDRLQSPEGLTEGVGNAVLSEAEPVFQQLDRHLKVLLGEAAAPTPEPRPSQPSLKDTFSQYVPRLLREMLDLVKQGNHLNHRSQLLEICASLHQLGTTYQLPDWQQLTQSICDGIDNPDCNIQQLMHLGVNELMEAQQLVLEGNAKSIRPSPELMAIASARAAAIDVNVEADSTGFPVFQELASESDWEETPSSSDLASLFDAAEPLPSEALAETAFDPSNVAEVDSDFSLLAELGDADSELADLFEEEEVSAASSSDTRSEDETFASPPILEVASEESGDFNLDLADLFDTSADTPSTEADEDDPTKREEDLEVDAPVGLTDLDDLLAGDESTSDADESWTDGLDDLWGDSLQPETTESFDDLSELLSEDDLQPLTSEDSAAPVQPSGSDPFSELADILGPPPPSHPPATPAVRRFSGVPPTPASPLRTGQQQRRPVSNQTMRVEVRYLDTINNMVGELVVSRNSLEQSQGRMRQFLENLLFRARQLSEVGQQMQDRYERSLLESSLMASRNASQRNPASQPEESKPDGHSTGMDFDVLEMDRFTAFHTLSQEIIELIVRIRESSSDIQFVVDQTEQIGRQFRQVTTQLQENLNRARMMPFSQIADRLPRAVRDLSYKTGKKINLSIEGQDTLIDKAILEELYDPMTHLVNNAIVHGIEDPTVRQSQGKPEEGTIDIQIFYQGNQIIIVVADDGSGINAARVKEKAIDKGLLDATGAHSIADIDLYDFIFHPGFSTRSEADELAGRGVGMDVVRTSLNELRGTIQVDSTPGKGTTFTIRLPLTLSVSKAMVCVSDKATIAFPLDGVEEMIDIPADLIHEDEHGKTVLPWRDRFLSCQPLSDLLAFNAANNRRYSELYGAASAEDSAVIPVVILQSGGQRVALRVDRFEEEQEIVIKQLGGPAPKPIGIAGATVLGDGRVLPIADTLELIDLAQGKVRRDSSHFWMPEHISTQAPEEQAYQPTVLIVDDSITVRELLSMTFSKVGYRVEQARDGQDAWDKLRSGLPCDLVFCDIEMPRMDGLELLSRLQQDESLKTLPVAMLTSRGADRHRQMAANLGASAYFTKPYLEEELLSAAGRLLQGEVLMGSPS